MGGGIQASHISFTSVTSKDGDTEGGAPVSLIEMSASGMPVVSTWHCDIPEVVEDGVTGLLVKERDVDGLVNALETLINNPDKWNNFGCSGRRRIEERHDIRNTVRKLEDIYKQAINT